MAGDLDVSKQVVTSCSPLIVTGFVSDFGAVIRIIEWDTLISLKVGDKVFDAHVAGHK